MKARASDNVHGPELWRTDGTAAGTSLVKDINPGLPSSDITNMIFKNGAFYFSANDGVNGYELWKSDGTNAGTVLLKNISSGSNSSTPSEFVKMGNDVYFFAKDPVNGTALWKTDGTTAGTVLIKAVAATPSGFPIPFELTVFNNMLIFHNADLTNGFNIWKSDGTTAGTQVIKTVYSTYQNINMRCNFSVVNGSCFFKMMDQAHGMELWTTDGTTTGTQILKDVWPGPGNGLSRDFYSQVNFSIVNDSLFFTANDGVNGEELWKSDGTAAGTFMYADIVPGSGGSNPKAGIVGANGLLFVLASTDSTGEELFAVTAATPATSPSSILEFNGHLQNNDVLLDWKTINEHNLTQFVVQRSINGTSFTDIATVAPLNTPGTHQYYFTDPDVVSLSVPTIYYRLKMMSTNVPDVYSNIVTIDIVATVTLQQDLILQPNPAHTNLQLTINATRAGTMWLKILDNAGREYSREYHSVSIGKNVFNMDVRLLPAGKYYLNIIEITGDLLKTTRPFIKL